MATNPAFASTQRTHQVQISTANTARDGTGTLGTSHTGGTSGTKIEEITIIATGTTTAGMVRLFFSDDSGTTKRLLDEFSVAAITPSGTLAAFRTTKRYDNLWLADNSDILYFATNAAETFNCFVHAADF